MMINEFLLNKLKEEYSNNDYEKIVNGYKSQRVTSFRVNTLKANNEEIENELNNDNISYKKSNYDFAYVTSENENKLTNLKIYEEGKIYLQSLSSMLPPIIMNPNSQDHILDMAAAPGGKTSEIAALTNNKCSITAIEINPIRAEKLKYNLNKLGLTKFTVLVSDARQLDDFYRFDKILLDAPCSGSGTVLENDLNNKQKFDQKIIEICQKRQIALLSKAIKILKRGGEIIYSTCSVLKEENEDVLKSILKHNKDIILEDLSEYKKDLPLLNVYYKETISLYPTDKYEGFFVAKLKKSS